MAVKHENSGACAKCGQIFNRFPGFNKELRLWFEGRQNKHPEFHIADAGRGEIDQERYFAKGGSDAHYGQSPHNYNCAIDTFFLINGAYNLEEKYFAMVLKDRPEWLNWYGDDNFINTKRYERPHFDRKDWKQLLKDGKLKLVEPRRAKA